MESSLPSVLSTGSSDHFSTARMGVKAINIYKLDFFLFTWLKSPDNLSAMAFKQSKVCATSRMELKNKIPFYMLYNFTVWKQTSPCLPPKEAHTKATLDAAKSLRVPIPRQQY
jgi:hypothetical protein